MKYSTVNVDEFLQEIETLGVHDLGRSASSQSLHTDHSGNAVYNQFLNINHFLV